MTNLINQALFRIDPTEGLLLYAEAIKPYHSKVLDVLVEYVYTEPMVVTAVDRHRLNIGLPVIDPDDPLRRDASPVTYTRGYGLAYSAYDKDVVGGLPRAEIVSAQGPIKLVCTFAGTTVTAAPHVSGYTPTDGTPLSMTTTGSFPAVVGSPITPGESFYVTAAAGSTFSISRAVGGAPIEFITSGIGEVSLTPTNLPVNSFLIQPPPPIDYRIAVVSVSNNQVAFVDAYTVIGVDRFAQTWILQGNHASAISLAGQIYINDNTDPNANKGYKVVSVTDGGGQTEVVVAEPLSLSASASGVAYTTKPADQIPYWPGGCAVQFQSSSALPFPLLPSTTYYVVPTTVAGVFKLCTQRFPSRPSDVIDFVTTGAGSITARSVEPFLPGELVRVTGSYQGVNDQTYVIQRIEPEGPNFRAYVREFVEQTTPISQPSDGVMGFVGTYGDPVGEIVSSPALYTATYFHERIDFTFGPSPIEAYLLDSFSGTGNLRGHVSNSGHTWSTFQLTDSIEEMIILETGGVTTASTDIWVRSNWTPPASPTTTYVEFDAYVSEKPATSSPYLRAYIKEANLVDFYGPHIDVYPTAAGKIELELWLGDPTVGSFHTIPTDANVNQAITVKLNVVNQTTVEVYVDNQLVFTAPSTAWPAFAFVGFNFRVPAADPSQFRLYRFQAQ